MFILQPPAGPALPALGLLSNPPDLGRCSGLRVDESDCMEFGQVELLCQGQLYLCFGNTWAHKNPSFAQKLLGPPWAPGVLTSTLCCRRVGSEVTLWEYSFRCTVGTRAGGSRREVRRGQLQAQWRRWGLGILAQRGAEQGRGGRKLTVDGSAAGPGHVDTAEASFLQSQ